MFLISPPAINPRQPRIFRIASTRTRRPRGAHERRVAVGFVRRQFVAALVVELQILADALVVSCRAARPIPDPRRCQQMRPCGPGRSRARRSRAPTPRPALRSRRTDADCCRSARSETAAAGGARRIAVARSVELRSLRRNASRGRLRTATFPDERSRRGRGRRRGGVCWRARNRRRQECNRARCAPPSRIACTAEVVNRACAVCTPDGWRVTRDVVCARLIQNSRA